MENVVWSVILGGLVVFYIFSAFMVCMGTRRRD
jgi:hypothetical protein